MKFIKHILAVSPFLNFALIVAIGSIILMEAYLLDMPEVVSWGAEFGAAYYNLCLSIMASYIFYFIVVHLKSQADKENINTFVATKSYGIVGAYKSQIKEMKKVTNTCSECEYFTKKEVDQIFKAINPKSNAPLLLVQFGNYANWIQYMSYHKDRTQKFIQKIFAEMPFLDSELVRLLAEIDDCSHFYFVESTLSSQFNNTDMSAWVGTFYEYSVKCQKLEEYNEKKLSQYKP